MTELQLETVVKETGVCKENILTVVPDENGLLEFSEDDFGEYKDTFNNLVTPIMNSTDIKLETWHRMGGDYKYIIDKYGNIKD